MGVSSVTSAVSSAASVPVDATTSVLKKTLDIAKQQGAQLADMVSQESGVGNFLNIKG